MGCQAFDLGAGNTALLLVHGFADSPSLWREMAPVLAEEGFHCRAMRLPGMAEPLDAARAYDDEDWLHAISSELDTLQKQYDQVWVVGHSLGGALCTRLLLEQRPAVAGVVLIAPAIQVSSKRSPLLSTHQWFKLGRKILPLSDTTESYFAVDIHDQSRDVLRDVFTLRRTQGSLFRTADLIRPRADEFDWPLLMVLTHDDKVVDTPAALDFFQFCSSPVKQAVLMPDTGHVIPLDHDWEALTSHMAAFIREGAVQPPPEPLVAAE